MKQDSDILLMRCKWNILG